MNAFDRILTEPPARSNEAQTILAIARRAEYLFAHIPNFTLIDLIMDIDATHRAVPLDLQMLEESGDPRSSGHVSFTHDLMGIWHHLDRESGALTDHWIPRFALR